MDGGGRWRGKGEKTPAGTKSLLKKSKTPWLVAYHCISGNEQATDQNELN